MSPDRATARCVGASYAVGKFLLKGILCVAVHAATSGLASPVLDVLDAAFDFNQSTTS